MNRRQVLALPLAAAFSARAQSSPRFTKGICSIIFPKEMPRPECFAQAKSAGFDAIEIAVGTDLSLDISHDDARRMADAAAKTGIRIATLWVSEPLHQNPLNAPEGDVNWKAVMAALVKIGYDGPLSPEIGRNPNQPDQLKEVSTALDKILALA